MRALLVVAAVVATSLLGAASGRGEQPCERVADLNCADIPSSKKPVLVTGSDPYGLDGNGDGWGCTS